MGQHATKDTTAAISTSSTDDVQLPTTNEEEIVDPNSSATMMTTAESHKSDSTPLHNDKVAAAVVMAEEAAVPPLLNERELQQIVDECQKATAMCEAMTPATATYHVHIAVSNMTELQDLLANSPMTALHNKWLMGSFVGALDHHLSSGIIRQYTKICVYKVPMDLKVPVDLPLHSSSSSTCSASLSPYCPISVPLDVDTTTIHDKCNKPSVDQQQQTAAVVGVVSPSTHFISVADSNTNVIATLSLSSFYSVYEMIQSQYGCFRIDKTCNTAAVEIEECPICMECAVTDVLPCGHPYCAVCIQKWNDSSDTCPMCRAQLNGNKESLDSWSLTAAPSKEEAFREILLLVEKLDNTTLMNDKLLRRSSNSSPPQSSTYILMSSLSPF
jgi:hypothetical protein